jgi:hypothetical protein
MKIDADISIDDKNYATRDKFAKMILGNVAGFVTAKLVENLYDKVVEIRRSKSA